MVFWEPNSTTVVVYMDPLENTTRSNNMIKKRGGRARRMVQLHRKWGVVVLGFRVLGFRVQGLTLSTTPRHLEVETR